MYAFSRNLSVNIPSSLLDHVMWPYSNSIAHRLSNSSDSAIPTPPGTLSMSGDTFFTTKGVLLACRYIEAKDAAKTY